LFQRHHSRVAAWCFRMTGNVDSAADLAQDVFLKAFQRMDSFRGDSRFTTWLYSIARNRCMDELRSRMQQPREETEAFLDEMPDVRFEDVSLTMERRESAEVLQELMRQSLDETETRVMTLHYVEEMPLDSVTRLLGLSNTSGAKGYVVSARRKLSRAFSQWKERTLPTKGAISDE
jgi:RNA polymerase sigma-70 factor (ECF subfamily)